MFAIKRLQQFNSKIDIDLPTAEELQQATLSLTNTLVEKPSVTPNDAGCLTLIENRLSKIGMLNERFDSAPVTNLLSSYSNNKPLFVFVGHVDVVPPGDLSNWQTDPFVPVEKDGYLYGRGSVDMKSAVAAMVVAFEEFNKLKIHKNIDIGLVLTSDEEGEATHGVKYLVEQLQLKGKRAQWALVGEPSSEETLGDSIKVGRRGSLTGRVVLKGRQGHVGYPAQIINPVKSASKLLAKFESKTMGFYPRDFFPATSFQTVKFICDSGAENISPASLEFIFNLRYSPKQTLEKLRAYIEKKIQKTGLEL